MAKDLSSRITLAGGWRFRSPRASLLREALIRPSDEQAPLLDPTRNGRANFLTGQIFDCAGAGIAGHLQCVGRERSRSPVVPSRTNTAAAWWCRGKQRLDRWQTP